MKTTTSTTAKARNEVKAELTYAVENKIERGTVVTSAGKFVTFTIQYVTLMNGTPAFRINIGRTIIHDVTVNGAASTALSVMGFTR